MKIVRCFITSETAHFKIQENIKKKKLSTLILRESFVLLLRINKPLFTLILVCYCDCGYVFLVTYLTLLILKKEKKNINTRQSKIKKIIKKYKKMNKNGTIWFILSIYFINFPSEFILT